MKELQIFVYKTLASHRKAWREAEKEKRIYMEIHSRRRYAGVKFDCITADPNECDKLTEEASEQIRNLYLSYLTRRKEQFPRRKQIWCSFGPISGSMTILKDDALNFSQQLVSILQNRQNWVKRLEGAQPALAKERG